MWTDHSGFFRGGGIWGRNSAQVQIQISSKLTEELPNPKFRGGKLYDWSEIIFFYNDIIVYFFSPIDKTNILIVYFNNNIIF